MSPSLGGCISHAFSLFSNKIFLLIKKIISKVLANCLHEVLRDIVSNSQGAFVKGRQILDEILIASECVDDKLKSVKPGVICGCEEGL